MCQGSYPCIHPVPGCCSQMSAHVRLFIERTVAAACWSWSWCWWRAQSGVAPLHQQVLACWRHCPLLLLVMLGGVAHNMCAAVAGLVTAQLHCCGAVAINGLLRVTLN